jgi:hypothetical protein
MMMDQETAGLVVMALPRVAVMDWATVPGGIAEVLASDLGPRREGGPDRGADPAGRELSLGRAVCGRDQEIAAIGWSGPGAPAHPRFP